MLVAACLACRNMSPHGCGAALLYGKERPFVAGQHPVAKLLQILRTVNPDDFRQCHHGLQAGHQFVKTLVQSLGDSIGEMEVDFCSGDVGMAEDFLQDGDVFTVFQQVRGKGVAVMPSSA